MYRARLCIAAIIGIMSVLAVCGIAYPVRFLDLELVPLLQRTFADFSIIAAITLAAVLLITLLFGRIYCSTICPFGILQDFALFPFRTVRRKINGGKMLPPVRHGNYGAKYLVSALSFGCLIGGSAIFIRYADPYTVFGSATSLSLYGIIFAAAVLVLTFFKDRFFCTNICPVGAVLGLLSRISVFKIQMNDDCVSCGMCAGVCPAGCIDFKNKTVDNEACLKCLRCLSACRKNAINYGIKTVKFNPKRRDALWGIGALAILGAGYAAGISFTKTVAAKVKNIILPPGAANANRMANKCLNCNLCVENCTNKILAKADEHFGTVHIDYDKGKMHCDFNCHKCGEICPSGAIKKISLEEKQSTRIAMATSTDACVGCYRCLPLCPAGAITLDMPDGPEKEEQLAKITEMAKRRPEHGHKEGEKQHHSPQEGKNSAGGKTPDNKQSSRPKIKIDGSKCIGCGKCYSVCRKHKAIKMHGIKEQARI